MRGVVESHSVGKCACRTQRTRNAEERAPEERATQRFEYFARGLQVGEGQRASNDWVVTPTFCGRRRGTISILAPTFASFASLVSGFCVIHPCLTLMDMEIGAFFTITWSPLSESYPTCRNFIVGLLVSTTGAQKKNPPFPPPQCSHRRLSLRALPLPHCSCRCVFVCLEKYRTDVVRIRRKRNALAVGLLSLGHAAIERYRGAAPSGAPSTRRCRI